MTKVMIVEDMVVIQEIFKEIILLQGHEIVFIANNGKEAVDYIQDSKNVSPDIILMDHRMPVKDGLTALKEIHALNEQIRIIFISADETTKNEALKFGANDYLIKPISMKKVLEMITS